MKPLTVFVVFAMLLASPQVLAQAVANPHDSNGPHAVEGRLLFCDQTLRDIEAVKRSIDASGSGGVTPSDDVRARRLIGIARRTAVETAAGPDLQAATSSSLQEILVYVPKLIDALTRQNPSDAPGRQLADGKTRVATVVDSAGLETAAHALNIVVDGLELAASAQDAGDIGWKTGDAGKEAAEMIKGSADCMLLIGRNAVLEQVIQSGLVILSETHAFDSSQIRSVTTFARQPDLTADQREEAASDLRFIEEADERIENLHQVVETELKEPAPPLVSGAVSTTEAQPVESSAEPPPSSEVEPSPSAEPEPSQSIAPDQSDQTSASQTGEEPLESTSPETEPASSDQQTDDSSPSEPSMDQDEAQTNSDDQPDVDTPPSDQVEASPSDVQADQAEVPDNTDADPNASASPQEPDPEHSVEPAVEPESPPPPPPEAGAPQEEEQSPQPPPAPPSR